MSALIKRLLPLSLALLPLGVARGDILSGSYSRTPTYVAMESGAPEEVVTPGSTIDGQPPLEFSDDGMVFDAGPYFDMGPPVRQSWWERGHISVEIDALIWWSHGMRLPPLVTTSPEGTPLQAAGVLGSDFAQTLTTSVLFGADRESLDTNGGGRIKLGYWTDPDQTLGIEGNFWALDGGDIDFTASSNGSPILARPFFNVVSESQDSDVLAIDPSREGNVRVSASNKSLGAEVYLFENIWMCCDHRVDFLYGYRFFRLDEDLRIDDRTEFPDGEGAIAAGTSITSFDLFDTNNEFHGGQFGFAWKRRYACWSLNSHFKLALGSTRQRVSIAGGSTTIVPDPFDQSTSEGGLLALPSNMGEYSRDRFTVIPEISAGASFWFTPHLKGTMSYDFIYVSRVARPGDQIDLNINPTQLGGGNLAGAARPTFFFDETDYWLQGFSLGLEYRH